MKKENLHENTQQLVAQERKGEMNMNTLFQEEANTLAAAQVVKARKLGTLHQQNLIELFTHIYFHPNKHTYNSLAHEMSKSNRTIQRMIDDINALYPYITAKLNDLDGCAHLKIEGKYSESLLDNAFQKSQYAPILYIFIKSLLGKPVSVNEIMQKVNVNRKNAEKIIDKIFETTPYGDFEDYAA